MVETRKLAAIVAADVAGYSKLAGADEERTLARLRALRSDLFDPTIALHHGRFVKRTGDGVLIEFRSVVDAVRCAIEVQNGMIEPNAGLPPARRIEFRVGIHVGDVVEEGDGDLMGDGVNIAARLEGIADPGSICLSEDAYRQVRDRVKDEFVDLGEKDLKNIARPVHTYRVALGESRRAEAEASTPLALPDKPSIAVLPFQNLSGNPEQEYFADGMVEEIITALSRIRWLFVIARNSTFTYKGQPIDVKQVGRDLGVRYVLEGSVRKGGNRVRITAQLIEAETGAHLWADRFDGSMEDVFDLQDQVATSVAGVIEPALRQAETRRARSRPTTDLTAYDLYLRADELFLAFSKESTLQALELLARAIERDPRYGTALGFSAFHHSLLFQSGWAEDPEATRGRGIELAQRALQAASDDPIVLAWGSLALINFDQDVGPIISLIDRALAQPELCPSLAGQRLGSGGCRRRGSGNRRFRDREPARPALHGACEHSGRDRRCPFPGAAA
jgi:adenylate cyclase